MPIRRGINDDPRLPGWIEAQGEAYRGAEAEITKPVEGAETSKFALHPPKTKPRVVIEFADDVTADAVAQMIRVMAKRDLGIKILESASGKGDNAEGGVMA